MKFTAHIKNLLNTIIRFRNSLQRPAKQTNTALLQKREETLSSYTIRDATAADIPELSALHVKTWADTYWNVKKPPTYAIREWQWKEQFNSPGKNWFCLLVQNAKGELVGFAKCKPYSYEGLPGYSGELNKIYLLQDHQRIGLGRKLLCAVAKRFLSQGISSMVLFGEPTNPSIAFHEAMGGKKLYAKNGEFHGGYGWRDINIILSRCDASSIQK